MLTIQYGGILGVFDPATLARREANRLGALNFGGKTGNAELIGNQSEVYAFEVSATAQPRTLELRRRDDMGDQRRTIIRDVRALPGTSLGAAAAADGIVWVFDLARKAVVAMLILDTNQTWSALANDEPLSLASSRDILAAGYRDGSAQGVADRRSDTVTNGS